MIFHSQLGSPVFYYLDFDAVRLPKHQSIVLLLESEIIEIQINFLLFDFQESTGCVCYAAKQHFNFLENKKTAANFSIFNFPVSVKTSRASWVLVHVLSTILSCRQLVVLLEKWVWLMGVVNAKQRLRGGTWLLVLSPSILRASTATTAMAVQWSHVERKRKNCQSADTACVSVTICFIWIRLANLLVNLNL